jgi:hypothetical protein
MDITSFVGKLLEEDDVDLLREGVRVLALAVMETEFSGQIGATSYERNSERTAYRNGYRTRRWDTRMGTIELKIPKVTADAYFPSLLEPRRRAEKALHAVVVEAYVKGISTRKVDDLVRALGIEGISRSEVSRICKVLDEEVKTFLSRPIEGEHPYVWLDATFHKVRQDVRLTSPKTRLAVRANAARYAAVRVVSCLKFPSSPWAYPALTHLQACCPSLVTARSFLASTWPYSATTEVLGRVRTLRQNRLHRARDDVPDLRHGLVHEPPP